VRSARVLPTTDCHMGTSEVSQKRMRNHLADVDKPTGWIRLELVARPFGDDVTCQSWCHL
jgi:hypothetical protein